ncbi:MAG: ABC transporter ATP-binding protein [Dehalococcoidia bacterium]|nr:ABC transporter ATP-binding protein [Dehalococcoidia bacterium]
MIELRDVQKLYKLGGEGVRALNGVSVTINHGEMVAIVGPSGSGKSTLMHILGCLDRPTSGSYVLDGGDVQSYGDDALAEIRRAKIGFVFQQFNLLPRMTALQNVFLPMIYTRAKERERRAMESLERVGLGHRAGHRPTELSGGEQQRVAIARALVNKPPVLLADEPTGNLDTKVGAAIMEVFRQLNAEDGITVILITHDPTVSASARRVISMRDGAVVSDVKQAGAKA